MEHKGFIIGLIVVAFLFYGVFLHFLIGKWRKKKEMFNAWEEEEKLQREKFLKEVLVRKEREGTAGGLPESREREKIVLKKGEKIRQCPQCRTGQKIPENAVSFVCRECGSWVNLEE